jgi:hypothetical protein
MERVFQYDLAADDWYEVEDTYAGRELEEIPFVLVADIYGREEREPLQPPAAMVSQELHGVWCRRHRCYEAAEQLQGSSIITKTGCIHAGLGRHFVWHMATDPFCGTCLQGRESFWKGVAFRWRIRHDHHGVQIFVDFHKLIMDYMPDQADGFNLYPADDWCTYMLRLVVRSGEHIAWPRQKAEQQSIYAFAMPECIEQAVMKYLLLDAEQIYGFRPTVTAYGHGWRKLEAFVEHPLNTGISYWQNFINESGLLDQKRDALKSQSQYELYVRLFPRQEANAFLPLCVYLHIQPTRSLQRAFSSNPFAPLWHCLLQKWGLQDMNYIQRFYVKTEIAGISLERLYYKSWNGFSAVNHARQDDCPANEIIWALEDFCSWMKDHHSERALARTLLRLVSLKWSQTELDSLRMFNDNFWLLSEALLDRVAHGETGQKLHDDLELEITERKGGNHVLPQDTLDLEPEEWIEDCCFSVPANTVTLVRIGQQMHNCAATYEPRIQKGACVIVSVIRLGRYVACLEVTPDRHIIQARGPYNEPLTDLHVIRACIFWQRRHALQNDVQTLAVYMPEECVG